MSNGGRMRPLLWLVLAWSVIVALSAPRLTHPSRGVAEALIILAALVLLVAHDGLRGTLAAAPRALRWPIAGAFAIWLFAQIREWPATTYPLQSWHMYGESLRDEPLEGYRLLGVTCDGNEQRVPWTGGALGRRPTLRFGIEAALGVHRSLDSTGVAAPEVVDSLLQITLQQLNGNASAPTWCRLDLQRVRIDARAINAPRLPDYVTIRSVTRVGAS